MRAWGGISSLQFGLPIVWTEARKRGFSLADICRQMSENPAKLVGLGTRKGAIAAGYDADLVVWNPDARFVVEPSLIRHRHAVTPYEGQTLEGVIERVYVRGAQVFTGGELTDEIAGSPL